MKKNRLHLYTLDIKYANALSKADDRVMSVSPQEGKDNRPFVGIVVLFHDRKYCIPLTSPKPKHQNMKNDLDFSKIIDKHGKLIGALNFNNMLPVSDDVITLITIKPDASDTPEQRKYKDLLSNQLDWCNDNADSILKKANKLYRFITETPEKSRNLTRRCCNFKKLEAVLDRYTERKQQQLANEQYINHLPKEETYFLKMSESELQKLRQKGGVPFVAKKDSEGAFIVKIALADKETVQKLLASGKTHKNAVC